MGCGLCGLEKTSGNEMNNYQLGGISCLIGLIVQLSLPISSCLPIFVGMSRVSIMTLAFSMNDPRALNNLLGVCQE